VAGRLKRILEIPGGFDLYQRVVGAPGAKRYFVQEVVRPRAGERVLDLGCGTGALCEYVPREAEYVGVDVDPDYVARARERFGGRAEFLRADIADLPVEAGRAFDVIMAFGVVHHLDDVQVGSTFAASRGRLAPAGRFVAAEPVARPSAGRFERFLMRHDRGRFIRSEDEYVRLAEAAFGRVSARAASGTYRIPFTVLLLEAGAAS
jgi:SAM-dependent methyltransferase